MLWAPSPKHAVLKHFIKPLYCKLLSRLFFRSLCYLFQHLSVGWHIRLFICDKWVNSASINWAFCHAFPLGGLYRKPTSNAVERWKMNHFFKGIPWRTADQLSHVMFSSLFAQPHSSTDTVAASMYLLFQLIINVKMQVRDKALMAR